MKFLRNYEDSDDVTTRPKVWGEQHGNSDLERNQRTRTLLEKRKDAILDALTNPNLRRVERKLLEAQRKEIRADIRILQAVERKWR